MTRSCPTWFLTQTRATVAGALVACTAFTAACSPFGSCKSDRIEAAFDATVTTAGADETWALRGIVTPGNIDGETYAALVAGLIDGDRADGTAGMVVTLDQGTAGEAGYLALHLGAAVAAGDTVPVAATFSGGGWGIDPSSVPVLVAMRLGAFQATAATGRIIVLGTAPLHVHMDVTASDGGGTAYRLRGVMRFARVIEPTTCD